MEGDPRKRRDPADPDGYQWHTDDPLASMRFHQELTVSESLRQSRKGSMGEKPRKKDGPHSTLASD